jgi:predicted CXXCH cytochrome family protein
MDIRTITVLIAACSLLFSTAYAGTARQATGRPTTSSVLQPIPIKKDCGICHLPAGSQEAGELKKKPSDLCLDCPRDRKAPRSHRFDIVPKMEVKGLPLADDKVTCITCHDPHANTYGSMLRMKSTDLCGACPPV